MLKNIPNPEICQDFFEKFAVLSENFYSSFLQSDGLRE